jgi:hypothetical protein
MILRFAILALASLLASTGCEGLCTLELRASFQPSDTTIAVGQYFRPRLLLSSCGGRQRWYGSPIWRSQDAAIASVDSVYGFVTGRSPGQTVILGSDSSEHVNGSVLVTVR